MNFDPISKTGNQTSNKSTVKLRQNDRESMTSMRISLMKRVSQFFSVTYNVDENETIQMTNFSQSERFRNIYCMKENLHYEVYGVGVITELTKSPNRDIKCCCMIDGKIYIGLKNNAEIQIVSYCESRHLMCLEEVWQPAILNFLIYPIQIKADNSGNIYLSGYFYPKINDEVKKYILLKYDRNRKLLLKTRKYDFPRFTDFHFDEDGSLLLISSKSDDTGIHHVCKISADFQTVFFKFNFTSSKSKYVPALIVCLGKKDKTWLSAYKDGPNGQESRLICINSNTVRGDDEAMAELMNRIDICAWCSDRFDPVQMCKFTKNCILAIDKNSKSLFCLSLNQRNQMPDVVPVFIRDQSSLTHVCSDERGNAYLFENNIIYKLQTVKRNRHNNWT